MKPAATVTRTCEQCSSPFLIRAWRLKCNPARFCGNKCRYAFMRGPCGAAAGPRPYMVGAANLNWRGGGGTARRAAWREGGEQRRWARAVKRRDRHTCQHCGTAEPRRLQAHHIVPWRADQSFRLSLENGVSLCKPCHEWVHSPANPGLWLASAILARALIAWEDGDRRSAS